MSGEQKQTTLTIQHLPSNWLELPLKDLHQLGAVLTAEQVEQYIHNRTEKFPQWAVDKLREIFYI